MGMFDYVNYEAPCYKCGYTLTEWQSRDGPCIMGEMLEPWQIQHLYTGCPKCKAWNEYKVETNVEHIVHSINFVRQRGLTHANPS